MRVEIFLKSSTGKPISQIFSNVVKNIDSGFIKQLPDVANLFLNSFEYNFLRQSSYLGSWPQSYQALIENRLTLVDTGLLRESVTVPKSEKNIYELEENKLTLGTSVNYAKYTQPGNPERYYLVISPDTLQQAGTIIIKGAVN